MKMIVCVDLGGTNLRVALGISEGRIFNRRMEKVDKSSGPRGIIRQILRMIHSLEKNPERIASINVATAGPLNLKDGSIVNSPHFKFKHIPIVKPLKDTLGVPVYFANDCVAGVIGEKEFGAGRKYSNIVYVTLSSGIGAGVFVDNHLLIGKNGNAHEVGHMTIDHSGKLTCGCGGKGHWEAYCGGDAAANFIKLQLESKPRKDVEASQLYRISGGNLNLLSSIDLFESAKKGDRLALEIVRSMGRLNAIGFANIVNAYDPELITVGGAIAVSNPTLVLGPVKRFIRQYSINRVPRIVLTRLVEDSVLYGSLRLSYYLDQ
ncbi:MAG: ROK family protein [Candidatus Bathyarchaeia archaeon]